MTQRELSAAIVAASEAMICEGVHADDVLDENEIEAIVRAALAAAGQARMDMMAEAMG